MSWITVMAHPGFEKSAVVSPREPVFDTREEAEAHLRDEAQSWEEDGYTVVEHNGTFLVSRDVFPTKVSRLLVREV